MKSISILKRNLMRTAMTLALIVTCASAWAQGLTINTADEWNIFATNVSNGTSYSGRTVTLAANISVSTMAGLNQTNSFKGTFDGGGHTLTFNYTATEQYAAPFRYIDGATIKNLHVDGTIQTSAKYAAGIAAQEYGTTSIKNCRSSIVVTSSVDGDGTHSGFVAVNNSGTLTIEGCVFDGKLLTTNGTNNCGGFVGWKGGTLYITNSIYNPAEIANNETEVLPGSGQYMSKTFARMDVNTITNCYYTRALGSAQGKHLSSITAGENVTNMVISPGSSTDTYNVSGITAYSGGGLDQNGTLYYGSGDHVSLTLSTTLPEPYAYSVTGGTLSGSGNSYMLNMPDADVTISIQPSGPYITLDPTSATVLTGFTQTLTASYGNVSGTPTITYSSSNTNVATVSGSGTTATVTAVAPGTASITATMTYEGNTYTGECPITVEDPSYCMPAPTSVDGKGITSLTFGSGDYQVNNSNSSGLPASSPYYGDYTSMVGGYEPGETATVTITYSTGSYTVYSYGTLIWVDWNKNYTFEDSEIVYTGTSAQGSNGTPQVLTATFTIPAAQAADDYRMRIAGADNYFDDYIGGSSSANHDPCFTSSYAVCHDYTLRVVAAGAYTITCATTTGGTISADKTYADESDVITITATPETDYLLTALTYTPEGGSAQNITFSGNTGTFTMPAANVTVNATFTQPNCPKPTNLTVSNLAAHSANVGWNGESECYTVRYRTATVTGTTVEQTYSYGFEDENLSDWTTHALGDYTSGTNWQVQDPTSTFPGLPFNPHGGTYVVMTRSYNQYAYNVDNWLITPLVNLGDYVKFWVMDDGEWHEHFEVWVSTATNATDDFVRLATPGNATNSWTEVTVEMGEYARQQGYIAIRHTDHDKNFLFVDDFGIYQTTNTYDYGTAQNAYPTSNSCQLTSLSPETLYEVMVQGNCGTDGTSAWSSPMYFTTPDPTFTKDIVGYGDDNNVSTGWYLIASPMTGSTLVEDVDNLITTESDYDLYYFDQTGGDNGMEWKNHKAHPEFTSLVSGQGYLYANSEDVTLTFTGTPYSGDGKVTLNKTTGGDFEGWNLVGNPFPTEKTIAKDFYRMNPETHAEIILATGTVAAMEGIFVQANSDGETVTFTPASAKGRAGNEASIVLNLAQNSPSTGSGTVVIDRAIVRFGEGHQLPKFQMRSNSTKVYIPQDGKDYAVVRSEGVGEMPVNFKAEKNGTYTLGFNTENVEFSYLHLIDNLTGADVDLLTPPACGHPLSEGDVPQCDGSRRNYTFEAKTTDYESRFKLVFVANNEDGASTGSGTFAFFNNGNWIISNEGEATLQVIDITGRILSSETINGSVSKSINQPAGVYMIRLINGENVKVQKIVVR